MDNLVYIFDNYTFSNNTFTFNFIKRWICYQINNIINNPDLKNKYNNIILIKTCPLSKVCFNVQSENIFNIFKIVNGIIFKKYDVYPNINLKSIAEEIINYKDENNKIFIFTSIYQIGLTNTNVEFITEKFTQVKNPIEMINIGKYPFLKQTFPFVNEYFIDSKISHIDKKIIESLENIFVINKIKTDDLDFITNNMIEQNNLEDLITLMYKIELVLLEFIDESVDFEKNLDQFVDSFKKIINKDINYFDNHTIILNLRTYLNQIKRIFEKKYNKFPISIPIESLDISLSETHIKYILEFYQSTYPKIYNNYLGSNIKNKKIADKTSLIDYSKILNLQKVSDHLITDDSKTFVRSNISMSNWIDEYNEYNPFGLLLKYNVSKFSFKGLIDDNSSILNNYPNLVIGSISSNFVSMFDYYQLIQNDLENNVVNQNFNENLEDNENNNIEFKVKENLNINSFVITDNLNGDTNIMLPIFINKDHWKIVRSLWTYHITFINNCFEFEYNKKMDNIYFLSLLKCFNNFSINQNLSESNIRLFIYYLRTCIQIMIDNHYISSIEKETDKFKTFLTFNNNDSPKFKNDKLKFFGFELIIRFIQLIVSSNTNVDKLKSKLIIMRNYIINTHIELNFTLDYWENIKSKQNEKDKELEKNIAICEIIQNLKSWFDLEVDLIALCELVNKIYSLKNFNQFLKFIDKNNGCMPINSTEPYSCNSFKSIYDNLINPKVFIMDNFKKQINIDSYVNN